MINIFSTPYCGLFTSLTGGLCCTYLSVWLRGGQQTTRGSHCFSYQFPPYCLECPTEPGVAFSSKLLGSEIQVRPSLTSAWGSRPVADMASSCTHAQDVNSCFHSNTLHTEPSFLHFFPGGGGVFFSFCLFLVGWQVFALVWLCSSCWPGASYANQTVLGSSETHLPLPSKCCDQTISHHTWHGSGFEFLFVCLFVFFLQSLIGLPLLQSPMFCDYRNQTPCLAYVIFSYNLFWSNFSFHKLLPHPSSSHSISCSSSLEKKKLKTKPTHGSSIPQRERETETKGETETERS